MPDAPTAQPYEREFTAAGYKHNWEHLDVCPRAKTLSGWIVEFRSRALVALACKAWECQYCGQMKIKRLMAITRDAKPNRFLTLTVANKLYASPRDAWEKTAPQIPILIRELRKRFGEVEYIRFTEATLLGYPHYHLLVRSFYLPQPIIKEIWERLTGASIVDVKQIHELKDAYRYCVKYLCKQRDVAWTDRRVSASGGFDKGENTPRKAELTWEQVERTDAHPAEFLENSFQRHRIVQLTPNLHLIDPPPNVQLPPATLTSNQAFPQKDF